MESLVYLLRLPPTDPVLDRVAEEKCRYHQKIVDTANNNQNISEQQAVNASMAFNLLYVIVLSQVYYLLQLHYSVPDNVQNSDPQLRMFAVIFNIYCRCENAISHVTQIF